MGGALSKVLVSFTGTNVGLEFGISLLVDSDPSYGRITASQPPLQSYAPKNGTELPGYLLEGKFAETCKTHNIHATFKNKGTSTQRGPCE